MPDEHDNWIWVYLGAGGHIASGVCTSRERAEAWIRNEKVTGLLTRYPVDIAL